MTEAIRACRGCGARGLEPVLSLGEQPLANALLGADELAREESRWPLDLVFCPACALVQLTVTVAPELLFREYLYFSSVSETMVAHARDLAAALTEKRGLGARSLVVEAASNDGYLLQHYLARGVPVLGIEPARNVARVAEERGIPTRSEFFGLDLARQLRAEGHRADVLHAHNVLAHVPDLPGFVEGMRVLLAPDGIAVVEVPSLDQLLEGLQFDTIYHEHLCYFSLTALVALFGRHGLEVRDVARVPVHGGSLRLFVGHAGQASPSTAVERWLGQEQARGLHGLGAYRSFAAQVQGVQAKLRAFLARRREQGSRLAAYGAAAKGTVLLNSLQLPAGTVEYVADRSPHKQGRFVPGVHLPIRPPEALLEDPPDEVLLLAWNIAEEVLRQQHEYRRRGGRFIVPLPEPYLIWPDGTETRAKGP